MGKDSGEDIKKDIVATVEEHTQLPPLIPPHDTSTPTDTITMQDVPNKSG